MLGAGLGGYFSYCSSDVEPGIFWGVAGGGDFWLWSLDGALATSVPGPYFTLLGLSPLFCSRCIDSQPRKSLSLKYLLSHLLSFFSLSPTFDDLQSAVRDDCSHHIILIVLFVENFYLYPYCNLQDSVLIITSISPIRLTLTSLPDMPTTNRGKASSKSPGGPTRQQALLEFGDTNELCSMSLSSPLLVSRTPTSTSRA